METIPAIKMLCAYGMCIIARETSKTPMTLHIKVCDPNAMDSTTTLTKKYYTDAKGNKVIFINRSKCDVI